MPKIHKYLKKALSLKITHSITARQCPKIKITFSQPQVLEVIK